MAESSFTAIMAACAGAFNAPGFENFALLLRGWLLASTPGRPSSALRALGTEAPKHFSAYYRFFGRARWDRDALGLCVLRLILPFVPDPWVTVVLDDTLAPKQGRHIWGANVHHDPLGFLPRSLSFGHVWVILAVRIQIPLVARPVAAPILFRLYRSQKKRRGKNAKGKTERKVVGAATKKEHRSRPQLAVEMLGVLREALGERAIRALGDSTYAGKSVARHLPANTTLISRMTMTAALYEPAPPRAPGQTGRPRKKGERLPSPREMARADTPWQTMKVRVYGKTVKVQYQTRVCLWYQAAGTTLVRVVLVRDPKGERQDGCFYSTDATMTPQQVVEAYGLRWCLEVALRDGKQLFGFARPQSRTRKAVERTAPFAFVAYALTLVWFAQTGHTRWLACCPIPRWYLQKNAPSVQDMLTTLRHELHCQQVFTHPAFRRIPQNYREPLRKAIKEAA